MFRAKAEALPKPEPALGDVWEEDGICYTVCEPTVRDMVVTGHRHDALVAVGYDTDAIPYKVYDMDWLREHAHLVTER